MSIFDKIDSITSLEQVKNHNINENKDYIILFFYWNSCGACHMTIPIVCKIYNNLPKNYNSKIIKVNGPDIKNEDPLTKMFEGGYPAFRILKRLNNEYVPYDYKDKKYTTEGFLYQNRNGSLSTENTLLEWIDNFKNSPIKENFNYINNFDNKQYQEDKTYDDGSGYSFMKLKEKQKSANKILNDYLKPLDKFI